MSTELPFPDTTDLRAGAPIHDDLLALLPLVGRWRGAGAGVDEATGAEFGYEQELTFAHDGRPFLVHTSRSWLIDDAGAPQRAGRRESGFWRPGDGPDDVEVVLSTDAGQVAVLVGVAGDQRWELRATAASATPTAPAAGDERRLYALRGDELLYVVERAAPGADFAPALNGRLTRLPA